MLLQAGSPTVNLTSLSDTNVTVGSNVVLELDIDVPPNTDATWSIDVQMPTSSGTPQIKLCDISVLYLGINVPCLWDNEPEYTVESGVKRRGVLGFGNVLNSGIRTAATDPECDRIRIRVVGQVLDHIDNVENAEVDVTVGVTHGANTDVLRNGFLVVTELEEPEVSI